MKKIRINKRIRKRIIVSSLLFIIIIGCLFLFYVIRPWIFPTLDEVSDSIVRIEIYDANNRKIATGSGFCAFESNYIVTNYHVIYGADSIKIVSENLTRYRVKDIIITDPKNDLAIISGDFSFKPLSLGDSNNLSLGKKILAVGSPSGVLNIITKGNVIENTDTDIVFSARIHPGSSGGVLLNRNYQAIGVVRAATVGKDDKNYAVNINLLKKMKNAYDNKNFYLINYYNNDSCRTYESSESLNRLIDCGTENEYYSFSQVYLLNVMTER